MSLNRGPTVYMICSSGCASQSEDAKKSYLIQLRKTTAAAAANNAAEQNVPNGMQAMAGGSVEGGNKGCSPSRAELLSYAKKLNMEEEGIKSQSEDAKKSYLIQLRKTTAAAAAANNAAEQGNVPNGMQAMAGGSDQGGNKGCSPSRAELLSYAKKLNMEEEGIKVSVTNFKSLSHLGPKFRPVPFALNSVFSRTAIYPFPDHPGKSGSDCIIITRFLIKLPSLSVTNQNSLFRSRDWLSPNQGPVFPGAYRPNEFRSYPNCISEYRDKAESLVSQTMPHGLVARSIGPFPTSDTMLDPHHHHHHHAAVVQQSQQLPSFHQDLPDHFSSAPAQFSSRRPHGYEPGSALTFEQILAQRKLHQQQQHHHEGPPPDESQSELLLKLLLEKKMEEQSEKVQDLLYQHQRQQQQQFAAAQQFKRTEELLSLYKRSAAAGPLLNQAQNPGGPGLGLNLSGISGMASYPGLSTANLAAAANIPRSTPLHQSWTYADHERFRGYGI
eukprot:sb/3464095/